MNVPPGAVPAAVQNCFKLDLLRFLKHYRARPAHAPGGFKIAKVLSVSA
jgi:hypothetical protein